MKSLFTTLCIAGVLSLVPLAAAAQCTSSDEVTDDTSSHYFGLRQDGVRIGLGQTFEVDCRARFESASCVISISSSGTLVATDEIVATLLDESLQPVATVARPVGFDTGQEWLQFDFSGQDIVLEPGTYGVVFHTEADARASILYNASDVHTGGRLYYWNGDFSAGPPSNDTLFQASWNWQAVPVEEERWGAVKSFYR